jgi:5-methylcytosine-specific restriction endonuclease McrBC regulatory subunit McrC
MPNLFETFMARWLEANVPPALRVHRQYHAKLDATGTYAFKIDLVLEERSTGRVLAVLDTKYKHRDKMDAADLAQVIAYATHRGGRDAFLVYPSAVAADLVVSAGPVKARAACFDLSGNLDVGGGDFLAQILAATAEG